ncbi:MAG: hypothetical protein M3O84_04215 [Actinomycetota bacterium]|nr:hypothetical protein [Actinomycetota bacterium]
MVNSILAFIEHTLELPPLGEADRTAYDYAQSFDFSRQPVRPVPMTHTTIPRSERRWLAQQPIREGIT